MVIHSYSYWVPLPLWSIFVSVIPGFSVAKKTFIPSVFSEILTVTFWNMYFILGIF